MYRASPAPGALGLDFVLQSQSLHKAPSSSSETSTRQQSQSQQQSQQHPEPWVLQVPPAATTARRYSRTPQPPSRATLRGLLHAPPAAEHKDDAASGVSTAAAAAAHDASLGGIESLEALIVQPVASSSSCAAAGGSMSALSSVRPAAPASNALSPPGPHTQRRRHSVMQPSSQSSQPLLATGSASAAFQAQMLQVAPASMSLQHSSSASSLLPSALIGQAHPAVAGLSASSSSSTLSLPHSRPRSFSLSQSSSTASLLHRGSALTMKLDLASLAVTPGPVSPAAAMSASSVAAASSSGIAASPASAGVSSLSLNLSAAAAGSGSSNDLALPQQLSPSSRRSLSARVRSTHYPNYLREKPRDLWSHSAAATAAAAALQRERERIESAEQAHHHHHRHGESASERRRLSQEAALLASAGDGGVAEVAAAVSSSTHPSRNSSLTRLELSLSARDDASAHDDRRRRSGSQDRAARSRSRSISVGRSSAAGSSANLDVAAGAALLALHSRSLSQSPSASQLSASGSDGEDSVADQRTHGRGRRRQSRQVSARSSQPPQQQQQSKEPLVVLSSPAANILIDRSGLVLGGGGADSQPAAAASVGGASVVSPGLFNADVTGPLSPRRGGRRPSISQAPFPPTAATSVSGAATGVVPAAALSGSPAAASFAVVGSMPSPDTSRLSLPAKASLQKKHPGPLSPASVVTAPSPSAVPSSPSAAVVPTAASVPAASTVVASSSAAAAVENQVSPGSADSAGSSASVAPARAETESAAAALAASLALAASGFDHSVWSPDMSVSKFDIMSPSAASMMAPSPRSSGAFAFNVPTITKPSSSAAGSNAVAASAPAAPAQASPAPSPSAISATRTTAARSPPPSFGSVAAARGLGRGASAAAPPRSPPLGSTQLYPATSGSTAAPLAGAAARSSSPTRPGSRPSLPASFSLGSTAPAAGPASPSGAASSGIPSVRGHTATGRRPPSRSPTHARGASRSDMTSASSGASAGPVSAATSAFFSSGLSDEELMLFDREYAHLMTQSPSLQRQALVAQRRHDLEKAHAQENARRAQEAQQKEAHAHAVREGHAKQRREITVGPSPNDDEESTAGTFITEARLGPSSQSAAASTSPRAPSPPAPVTAAAAPTPMGFDQLFPFEQRDALNPRGGVGAGMIYYRLQGETNAAWNRSGMLNASLAGGQQQLGDGSATSMKSSAGWRKRQALKTNAQILAQIDRYWTVFTQTTPPAVTAAGVAAAAAATRTLALPSEVEEKSVTAKAAAAAPYVSPRRAKAKQLLAASSAASASSTPTAFPGITRAQYVSLHLSLTKALYEVWQLGAAQALAGVEWTKDLLAHDPKLAAWASPANAGKNSSVTATAAAAATATSPPPPALPKRKPASDPRNSLLMTHACFRRALFEMVDLWTESIDAAEYARFLDLLLLRITKPNPHAAVTEKKNAAAKGRKKKPLPPPNGSNPLLASSPLVWRTLPEVLRFNRAITLPVGSFYKVLLIQRWWRRWWGVRQRKAVAIIASWWVQWKPTLVSKRARKQLAAVRIQRFFRRRRIARLQAHKAQELAEQNLRRMASTVSEGDEHHGSSSDEGSAEDDEDGVSIPSEHEEEDHPTVLADADAQLSLRELREKLNHQSRLDEQSRDLMLLLWCCRRLQKFWRRLQTKRKSQADYAQKLAERRAAYVAQGREKGEARRATKLKRRPSMNLALLAMLEEAGLLDDDDRGDETLAEAEAREIREAEQHAAERLAIAEKARAAADEAQRLREAAERAERVREAFAEKLVSGVIAAVRADLTAEATVVAAQAAAAATAEAAAKLAADAAALMGSSDTHGGLRPVHDHVHHAYTAAQFPFVLGAGPVLALRMYCSSYRARHHASAPLSSTRVAAQFLHALLSKAGARRKRNMHDLESRIAHLKRRARRLEKEEGSRSLARLMQGFVEEQAASSGSFKGASGAISKRSSGGVTITLTNHNASSAVSSPAFAPSKPPALVISQSNSPALMPLEEPTFASMHAIAGHGLPGLTLAAPANGIGSPVLSPRSSAAWSAQAWNPLLLQASANSPGSHSAAQQFPSPYDRNIPSPVSFSEALAQIDALENLPLHLASEAMANEHAAAAARDADNDTKPVRPEAPSDLFPAAAISTLRLQAAYPKCNAKWLAFVTKAFPFENPRWPRPGQQDGTDQAEGDSAAAKQRQAEDDAAAAVNASSKPGLHRLRTQGGTLLQAEDLFHVGPLDRSHYEHDHHRLQRRASMKALAQSKARELTRRHGGAADEEEESESASSSPSKTSRRVSINDPKSGPSSSKRSKRYSAPAGAKISATTHSSPAAAASVAAKKKRATLQAGLGLTSARPEGVDEGEEEGAEAAGAEDAANESASDVGDDVASAVAASGGKKQHKSKRAKKPVAAAPSASAEDAALAVEAETVARKARQKARKAKKRAKEQRKDQKQIQRRLRKAQASLLAPDGRAGPSASDPAAAASATSSAAASSLVAHLSGSSSSSSSSSSSRSSSVASRSRASSRHSDSNWGASSRAARSGEEGEAEDEELSSDSDLEAILNAAHEPSSGGEGKDVDAGGSASRPSSSKAGSVKSSRSRRGSTNALAEGLTEAASAASTAGAPMTKAEMSAYVAKLKEKQERAAVAAAAEEEALSLNANASPRDNDKDAAAYAKPSTSRKSTLHRGASKSNLVSPAAGGSKPRGSVSFQRVSSVTSPMGGGAQGKKPAMVSRTKSTSVLLRAKSSSSLSAAADAASTDPVVAEVAASSLLSNDIDAWSSDGAFSGGLNSEALKLEHLDDVTAKLLRNQEAGNLDIAAVIEARKPPEERKQSVVRQASKAASAAANEEAIPIPIEAAGQAEQDQKEDKAESKPRSTVEPTAARRPIEQTAAAVSSRVVVREPIVFSPAAASRPGEPSILLRIQQAPISHGRDVSPRGAQQDSLPSQQESQRLDPEDSTQMTMRSGLPPHRQPYSQRRQPHHLEAALEAGRAAGREYTGAESLSFSSRRGRRVRDRNRNGTSFGSRHAEHDGEEDVRDFAGPESSSKGAGRGFSFGSGGGGGSYAYDSGFVAGSATEMTTREQSGVSSWGRGGHQAQHQHPQQNAADSVGSSSVNGSGRTLEGLPITPFVAGYSSSAKAASAAAPQVHEPRTFVHAPFFKPWRPGGATDLLKPKLVYSVTESEDRRRMREERRQAMIAAMHAPRIHFTPAEIRARRRERQERAAARRAERMRLLVAPSAELLASWEERSSRKEYYSASGRRMAVALAAASTAAASEPVVRSRAVAAASMSEASDAAFSGGSDTDSPSKQQRSRLVASNSQKRLQALRDEGRVLRQLRREQRGPADEQDASAHLSAAEAAPESSAVETSAVEEESCMTTDDEDHAARSVMAARRGLTRQLSVKNLCFEATAAGPTITDSPAVTAPSVSMAQPLPIHGSPASDLSAAGVRVVGGAGLRSTITQQQQHSPPAALSRSASLARLEESMTIRGAQSRAPGQLPNEGAGEGKGSNDVAPADSPSLAIAPAISSAVQQSHRRSSTGAASHAKLHTGRVGLAPLLVADGLAASLAAAAVPAGIKGLSVTSPALRERRQPPQPSEAKTQLHEDSQPAAPSAATAASAATVAPNPIYVPSAVAASAPSDAADEKQDAHFVSAGAAPVPSLPPLLFAPVAAIGSPVGVASSSHRGRAAAASVSSLSAATQERVSGLRAIKAAELADLARVRSNYENEKRLERETLSITNAWRRQESQQQLHGLQRDGSLPTLLSPLAGSTVFARDASGRLFKVATSGSQSGSQSARTSHLSPSRSEGHLPSLVPLTERPAERRRGYDAAGLHIRRARRSKRELNAAWMSPPRRHELASHSDSEHERRFDFNSGASDSDGGGAGGRGGGARLGARDFRIRGNGGGGDRPSGMHRFIISERDPTAPYGAGLVSLPVSASLPSLRFNPARPSAAASAIVGAQQSGFSVAIDSAQLAAHKHLSIDALLSPSMHLGKLHRGFNNRRNRAPQPVQPSLPQPQPQPQPQHQTSPAAPHRIHRQRSLHPPTHSKGSRPPAFDRDLKGVQVLRADVDATSRDLEPVHGLRDPYAVAAARPSAATNAVAGDPVLPSPPSDAASNAAAIISPPSLRHGLSFPRPSASGSSGSLLSGAVSGAGIPSALRVHNTSRA